MKPYFTDVYSTESESKQNNLYNVHSSYAMLFSMGKVTQDMFVNFLCDNACTNASLVHVYFVT